MKLPAVRRCRDGSSNKLDIEESRTPFLLTSLGKQTPSVLLVPRIQYNRTESACSAERTLVFFRIVSRSLPGPLPFRILDHSALDEESDDPYYSRLLPQVHFAQKLPIVEARKYETMYDGPVKFEGNFLAVGESF
jgi:hypothetical protein